MGAMEKGKNTHYKIKKCTGANIILVGDFVFIALYNRIVFAFKKQLF